jgi:hypothetical protein
MSSPRRFMAIFDAHAGWDKRWERGQLVTRPAGSWQSSTRIQAGIVGKNAAFG